MSMKICVFDYTCFVLITRLPNWKVIRAYCGNFEEKTMNILQYAGWFCVDLWQVKTLFITIHVKNISIIILATEGLIHYFSLLTLFQSHNFLISYNLAMAWSICFVFSSKIVICSWNRHDEKILICSWRYSSGLIFLCTMHVQADRLILFFIPNQRVFTQIKTGR